MPMPKGTKPNVKRWIEVNKATFYTALEGMRKNTTLHMVSRGNANFFTDRDNTIVGRHYKYRKSEQYLISAHLQEHVKDPISFSVGAEYA